MAAHTGEPIFFRTEHHWTALGAYYAAQEFAKTVDVPFPPLSEYEMRVKHGFTGSLYVSKHAQILKDYPDDIEYYVNKNAVYTAYCLSGGKTDFKTQSYIRHSILYENHNNYGIFLALDDMSYKIVTNAGTGRSLVVLKDSFGNAVVPFLLSSFDTIYVVDFRFYKRNCVNFIKETGVTDVLVVASGFSACGSVGREIKKMIDMEE